MAVAIETRFHGPTNHKGSRVSARVMESFEGQRESVMVSWDHELDPAANHAAACCQLLAKLHAEAVARRNTAEMCGDFKGEHYQSVWRDTKKWVNGASDRGYVWVHCERGALAVTGAM